MADGRRHSVDIPISKTLVALRRVRSLRDPSTNSMSKFSALFDNLNWETNSLNGISLCSVNGCPKVGSDNDGLLGLKNLGYNGQLEEHFSDLDFYYNSGRPEFTSIPCKDLGWVGNSVPGLPAPIGTKQVEGLDYNGSTQEGVYGKNTSGDRYCIDSMDKELDLTCITPSSNRLEDVDSCNGPIIGSSPTGRIDYTVSKRKSRYRNQIKSSGVAGDVVSCVGSPCPSISEALLEGSSHSTSLFANEEVDLVDRNHSGCGISCCWSRSPRFRESNLPSDVEEYPLLSGEVSGTVLSGQRRSWKYIKNEIIPYVESPRSLSQKFRPKFFNELVGQNVVTRSLLSAISKGRVTSFYLFHGPRGTGKTSASRIFAAALNCLSLEEHRPCGLCQECLLFFSGKSRAVKEVDSVRINRRDRVKSLIKNAVTPPVSSRFKVFIIDECQLLRGETWATVLNSLDDLSEHVVFVMITADLDKLPRSAVSRSQRYHFPKIKDADIACRLEKICVEEGLDFDQIALDFIAAKSNGSLRDAEMMLDQLSLLGKRITMSLTYELIGIVSDDELLDLLDLALSSDTSNTVRRARELMRTRIDPMQLISQLANLIMDIIAGKCPDNTSEVGRKFFGRHTSEADLQKLGHALKILSEAEKQLRLSKNQTTWLTVALLQLSSVGSSVLDPNDSRVGVRTAHQGDGDFCSTSSTGESLKHLVTCVCDENKSQKFGIRECMETLESTWKRATELCQSSSLKNFLRKQGKLSSVCVNQGLAVAELEFHHPDYVSRAEKSWKLIASSLQTILGCNVEIRINLAPCASVTRYAKVKKPSFSFFSCSLRMQHKSQSTTEQTSDQSDCSDLTSEKAMIRDKPIESCSSDCGPQISHICYHRTNAATTIRNSEGNALSMGRATPFRSVQDDMPMGPGVGIDFSKEEGSDHGCRVLTIQEPEFQPNCFFRAARFSKRLQSSDSSQLVGLRTQPQNKHALSIPKKTSFKTYCCANDCYIFCCGSNNCTNSSRDIEGPREDSKAHCWKVPSPLRKAWQLRHQRKRSHLVGWVLPCAATK
ncbi:hypothetical protein L1049_028441 [Liquidambar formosana]|uniref:AAA+ ATPase domain-containing protein n=1 Tax=Liquidambar formosana TaxID=63359 RepID=A0AAP0RIY7_LIQFO